MGSRIERTTALFLASVREALPAAGVSVARSRSGAGRSNYVYLDLGGVRPLKVRISDHPVGMRRALYGDEALFLAAGARPAAWAVFLGGLVRLSAARGVVVDNPR